MIRVKICGITREQDALDAVHAGASAVGFVFWPQSPRYVTPAAAADIAATMPPHVARVGVFVNEEIETIENICQRVGLSAAQLHGDEPPKLAHAVDAPVIKAFRGPTTLVQAQRYRVSAWLLDGAPEGRYGGAGEASDEASATVFAGHNRFILAGGLTPDNVVARCRAYRPAAVDAASGVERAPGIKDPMLMRRFVEAVRAVEPASGAVFSRQDCTGTFGHDLLP